MADEASIAGTSSCHVPSESLESTIEINIKTLDSKIYTFRVNKDMPVTALKAKLVDASGIPVERQRLIFRGRVLKDDHLLSEYQLEDGHTLHLVARQPIMGQSSSGTGLDGTAQDNNIQGNDTTSGAPRSRVGQVSHNVILGTVNLADQGESVVTDIGRLVGAVLSSLGVGNGAPSVSAGGMASAATAPNQAPSRPETVRNPNASGSPLSGNPSQPGISVFNNLFQPQFPSAGILPQHTIIPDSLTTLSEFMSNMELALQNDGPQSSLPTDLHDPLRTESSPLSARGVPTPEVLRTVMEQAQQLLRGNAATALSRVAARLEREGTSTDTAVRSQIQAEAMHVGAAMQHLGAMLLELGRAIMTLRMGQSPADSVVNSGPAVYISSTGPNPIMVQPFPLQTNSLFGVSPTPLGNRFSGPIPTGDPSRNINIHIHAGSPFIPGISNATAGANSGAAVPRGRSNAQQANRGGNGTESLPRTRGLPPRTVVAAIPVRPVAQSSGHVISVTYPIYARSQLSVPTMASAQVSNPTLSSDTQPMYMGVPPPSESGTLSNIVAQISAQVANALSGTGQGLGSVSQVTQSVDAQTFQAESQPSVPNMASAQVSNSTETQPTYTAVPPLSESGTFSNIVTLISSQVANALAGAGQGLGPLSQGLQPTDAQASQAQSRVGSQVDQAAAEANTSSGGAQGISSSRGMQATDSSYVERPQQVPPGSFSSELSQNDMKDPAANVVLEKDINVSVIQNTPVGVPGNQGQEVPQESSGDTKFCPSGGSRMDSNSSATTTKVEGSNDRSHENYPDSITTTHTGQSSQRSDRDRPTPLGLGIGGLQPKRQGKTEKPAGKDKASLETPSVNQNQQSIVRGQQFLHSLLSRSSDADGTSANDQSNPQTSITGQIADSLPSGRQGANGQGQVDVSDMMSQIFRTPAFSNLFAGVAEQTGIGSSDDLKSMLEQCAQNPAVRNTLNGITQQVERRTQSSGDVFLGTGRGQGGLDFSRMIQQMMPAVSQALGGISTRSTPTRVLHPNSQAQDDDEGSRQNDMLHETGSLVDLGRAVEMVEHHDAPENIFRSMLQSAGHLLGGRSSFDDLVSMLINNEELTNGFMSMLCRDLHQRLQRDSTKEE